jgi:uncharacterized membrane protein
MPFGVGGLEFVVLLLAVALFAVPIILALLLARAATGRSSAPRSPDPRAVLADRLARHEITQAEFDTAMRALGYGSSPRW